jgi:hypothetical protein
MKCTEDIMTKQPTKNKAGRPKSPTTVPFSVRLKVEDREALIKAGAAEDRPAAWIAQRAIVAWLKAEGWIR